ncbi:hypothetical protein NBT05_05345 [Aquimarina sp. ERC-38]|uniref:hypothetical protein n=1 Tax=Aquimarina sp. ERC-38 TaxID=2949996 RepID=UPI002245B88F|nr:hypothetical protein [Aquimarina sp. ERC-38]UZO81890.1 hypothetical protein NBT05_05345 [Aquimarina sp. ERC-38]
MIILYCKESDQFINDVINWIDDSYVRIGERELINISEFNILENNVFIKVQTPFISCTLSDDVSSIWINGGNIYKLQNKLISQSQKIIFESFVNTKKIKKIGNFINTTEINKINFLIEARKHELNIPPSLLTSSKSLLLKFYKKFYSTGGIICKRITEDTYYETNNYIYDIIFTFKITNKILKKIPENFGLSFFQKKLNIIFEVRAIYFNQEFYSASIHCNEGYEDYRIEIIKKQNNIRIIPFNLPKDLEIKIKSLLSALKLNYASIDLIFDGKDYYILEINPTGQIDFINKACNFYLERKIAKYLSQNE